MILAVIGTGYVGLVTGACFAEMGNEVWCIDTDIEKIYNINNGNLPIYEPGLDSLVTRNMREKRLFFTSHLAEIISKAELIFIAVGTPPSEDGSADLSHVLAVAQQIGRLLDHSCVIVNKSTVPVGTGEKVQHAIEQELALRGKNIQFEVVSNPEFLKEGVAIDDFMKPDRIIIGTNSEPAKARITELYAPFCRISNRIIYMSVRDAEMTKYAANAMLATKISFMNEIANICERLHVDVENIRIGIGADSRIGYHFIYPGCGYGGSCFPKDVEALMIVAQESGFEPSLLRAVDQRNHAQKQVLAEKIISRFGSDLNGLNIAVWGLAFKPGTDDIREAPALVLIRKLLAHGANVIAYDPVASVNAKLVLDTSDVISNKLTFADDQYDAVKDCNALVLVTEWKPFRYPNFAQIHKAMHSAIIFDGRNQYDPRLLDKEGFEYFGIGRTNQLASLALVKQLS